MPATGRARGDTGDDPWWVRACGVLGASGVGRAAGLSAQLAADAAMVGRDPAGGGIPLRIVVARTAGDPGLVPLLTGVRIADPPFATDLLPVSVVHCAAGRPELRLPPARTAALDRLARLLTTGRTQPPAEVLRAAPRTAAWLRVRASETPAGPFFGTGSAGADAVARTVRRCHDLTSAAALSPATDTAVAALLGGPVAIRARMRGAPLPWPAPPPPAGYGGSQDPRSRAAAPAVPVPASPGRAGLHLEVVDLPVVPADRTGPESGRAVRGSALELLHAAHLVLAVVTAGELGGDVAPSPAVAVLGGLLDRVRRAPHPPAVVLVATVSGLRGSDGMVELGSWLRHRGGRTVGPAAEGLPVRALALDAAGRAVRLLDGAGRRPGYAVLQAEADYAASGLAALCDDVLRPLADEAPARVPELTVRRVRAACRDIRLGCLDLTARHRPSAAPAGAADVRTGKRDGSERRNGKEPQAGNEPRAENAPRAGSELWDRLEAFAVSALAERTVRHTAVEGVRQRGD